MNVLHDGRYAILVFSIYYCDQVSISVWMRGE